ncbi:MAG: ATP phosphoribosyltransferase regulatory subunit, partial [Candidatus Pacearchaeota archaeon]|nr:ATP phosphoribosyltransferase regulatory subunit [Candidatus Pacearchaeota archaeon]
MITETVKGFSDYTLEEAEKRERIREILVKNFKLYGFQAEETPIVEYGEFVKDGNEQDEAVSDVFKLKDKGMRDLALRYELTFQLKRTANNKKLPYKRYQIGQVFRDEPVSSNRFRQFTQADIDIIGSSVKDEAEILALTCNVLKELGIKAEIEVNSRKLMNSVIKSLGIENVEFVLREIDKLDKQGAMQIKLNLAKFIDKERIIKLFNILNKPLSAFKKFEGYLELKQLIDSCENYKVKVKFNPTTIRGLSYYNGNVWEVKTQEMKEKINGGGSYLINNIPSTGISFGIDRLAQLAKLKEDKKKVLVLSIN